MNISFIRISFRRLLLAAVVVESGLVELHYLRDRLRQSRRIRPQKVDPGIEAGRTDLASIHVEPQKSTKRDLVIQIHHLLLIGVRIVLEHPSVDHPSTRFVQLLDEIVNLLCFRLLVRDTYCLPMLDSFVSWPEQVSSTPTKHFPPCLDVRAHPALLVSKDSTCCLNDGSEGFSSLRPFDPRACSLA